MTASVQSGVDRGPGDTGVTWTAPTLLNSWANVASHDPAGYSRGKDGVVQLRGTIDSGTKAAGTDLFVLPPGFRPAATKKFTVADDTGAAITAKIILVQANGTVEVGSVALVAATAISLDGISFLAAA